MPSRSDLSFDPTSPAPATLEVFASKPELQTSASVQAVEADRPEEDDFLAGFMDQMEDTPGQAPVFAQAEVTHESDPEPFESMPEVDIRPVQASRELQQTFPMASAKEAMALAAMPHYEMGGKNGVQMSQLEMRWLMAEAEATLKGPDQNLQRGERSIETDNGGAEAVGTFKPVSQRDSADAAVKSLLEGGYIREVHLGPEDRRAQAEVDSAIRATLPKDWAFLQEGVDPKVAYVLTDEGIAAGRSVRAWDGNTPDAGLTRLPGGERMPPVVASESYALSAMVMENRAMAGALEKGEMGAFYRAELATVEYGLDRGADPVVTAGRVDSILDSASMSALEQIENGQFGHDAALRVEDMQAISDQAGRVIGKLPEVVRVNVETTEGPQVETLGLDKSESRELLARLDGVRLGTELILAEKRLSAGGADLTTAAAWQGSVRNQADNLTVRNAISVARAWVGSVAEKADQARQEVQAMAQGAFGDRGGAMAAVMLEASSR